MKAYTSRARFDESRRFTFVGEEMGRVRLDSDANEQARLVRTDARRRSGDLAEGSPDDGFLIGATQLLDPIASTVGWAIEEFGASEERRIRPELRLDRREPESLPHVIHVRGALSATRTLAPGIDLLHLSLTAGGTTTANALIFQVRFQRQPTDDEIVDVGPFVLDANGTRVRVGALDAATFTGDWQIVRVPLSDLAALPRTALPDGSQGLILTGWGFLGLPPRANVSFDALLAETADVTDADVVIRGGDGTLARAGRLYVQGYRTFIERDWRYSTQPSLPSPAPLARPADLTERTLVEIDIWERPKHSYQDPFISEPALDGDDPTFRGQKVTQVRVRPLPANQPVSVATPTGGGRLTTNIPAGALPDRFPPEPADPCRDRCLFSENVSTGEGYRGRDNIHVRVEILATDGARPVIGWSRNNGATVAPLVADAADTALSVTVSSDNARRFMAGDMVVIEDERSRLDPDRDIHRARLRRLRSVDTATGRLEFEPAGVTVTTDPDALVVGGPLGRGFAVSDHAAIRLWDGVDWLLTGVRYNLADGITFAFSGNDFRTTEYWSFIARVTNPDGGALGVVEQLTNAPVHGPWHARAPLALVTWTATGRTFEDLRLRFMPLQDVRDRLIELGRRHLSPGAFTIVVGDGVRTYGDIDQNLEEGVTGDEAIQAALDQLGPAGGSIYIRAGQYQLDHPVLLLERSNISILGDPGASRLDVRGAGGAFFLDSCGHQGGVSLEGLDLTEAPAETTRAGGSLVPDLDASLGRNAERPGDLLAAIPFRPVDLIPPTVATTVDLLGQLASTIRVLRPSAGRAGLSVVRTITRLRALQRAQPDLPLEQSAPDELAVLRTLPHGVVTISDSSRIRLEKLTVASQVTGSADGTIAAGVLLVGTCVDVTVSGNRISASSGIVAAAYGRLLTAPAFILRPRAGLFLNGVTLSGNHLIDSGTGVYGIRIADGDLTGLAISDNVIDGFDIGIGFEDRAESRFGEPVDRTVVSNNRVGSSRRIGIRVGGDGADIDSNDVRLAPGDARLHAAIQVTGSQNRVRDNWLTLPQSAGNRPPLALEAGIVVGLGIEDGTTADRAVSDIEVIGNRIEGAGATTLASGIVIAGALPIHGVTLRGNTIGSLGDAGIRAVGQQAAIGGLTIEGNRIATVSLAYLSWAPALLDDIRTLAPGVAIAANATSSAVLTALNAAATVPRAATEAVLRWLEAATLRGGIVLSLAEECVVRGNSVRQIGGGDLPAGFIAPGAEVRTGAIIAVGGRDVAVQDNEVEQVKGAVERPPPPPPPPPRRPPIFDHLRGLDLSNATLQAAKPNVFAGSVALRRQLIQYAQGTSADRQRLGTRIYGALDALQGAMDSYAPSTKRTATQLGDALSAMLRSQSAASHLASANMARAILSDAAALTANDGTITDVWSVAARFDQVALGDDNAAVTAAAQDVVTAAPDLLKDLGELNIPLVERANAVVREPANMAARLALADALGTVAEARTRKVTFETSLPPGGPSTQDKAVFDGLVRVIQNGLGEATPAPTSIGGLQNSVDALAANLDRVQDGLAQRLRSDFQTLKQTQRPTAEQIARFRATVSRIGDLAAGNISGAAVNAGDVQAQMTRFTAELVVISARQLDSRLAELSVDSDAAALRLLRLMHSSAGQLVALVDQPSLATRAKAVETAVAAAVSDPANRGKHQQEARDALADLLAEQSRLAGVELQTVTPVEASGASTERVASLGQLLLDVQATTDADTFREGLSLFSEHVQRSADELGLAADGRELVLSQLRDGTAALAGGPTSQTRAAGLASLGNVVERLGEQAAKVPEATEESDAVRTLGGVLRRALSTEGDEATRLEAVRGFVLANPDALAASRAQSIRAVDTVANVFRPVRDMLGIIARVPRIPIFVPGPAPVRPHPADGLFAAGIGERLHAAGNTIEDVRVGIAIGAPATHPLVPPDATTPAVTLAGNRVFGAAVGAIDVDPGADSRAKVTGNEVAGSGGVAVTDADAFGQSIIRVRGRGDLAVDNNRLRDNGNSGGQTPLHEILIDWDGDVAVRDNRIRHAGTGAGGAGIVAVYGTIDAALVRSLSLNPPLSADPPAPPKPTNLKGTVSSTLLDSLLASGLTKAGTLGGTRSAIDAGGLKLETAPSQPAYAVYTAAARPAPVVTTAETRARAWLDRPVATTATVASPLLDFIRKPIIGIIRFPPILAAPRWSLQVGGNDIVANGPALLVLAGPGPILSATVVGNDFETLAATAAVYLRDVDTTIFSENRCESLRYTNVAVIRCRQSLVSVVGNAAVGSEPVVRPPRPVPLPKPLPTRPGAIAGSVFLTADLGTGSAVSLPLDSKVLLDKIRATQDTSFGTAADTAQANFGRFALRNAAAMEANLTATLARRSGRTLTMEDLAGIDRSRIVLRDPASDANTPGAAPSADAAARAAGVSVSAGDLIVNSTELAPTDKIFGLARLSGLSDVQANQFVRSQLIAAEGNHAAALAKTVRDLTGVDSTASAAVPAPTASNLLEQMLVLAVADKDIQPVVDPVRPVIIPRPRGPLQYSIVILGGSRIAAVGNTSTAGVYTQPGVDVVQLNP
ncbi:MAG: right-handed parallel beta-helix repeat-containing protein [Proteobacteria bacterium]|nr:right-handed parallel beta-helix repeat-containing protein [Pseudomonadota bacterium]